jgi:hypothetical protein
MKEKPKAKGDPNLFMEIESPMESDETLPAPKNKKKRERGPPSVVEFELPRKGRPAAQWHDTRDTKRKGEPYAYGNISQTADASGKPPLHGAVPVDSSPDKDLRMGRWIQKNLNSRMD